MTATRTATKRGRGRAPAAPANPPDVARQLFDANLPLAYHLARKRLARLMPGTRRQAGGIEGMEQTALIGLWAAARGYRADSGVRFSTYAWHTVNGVLFASSAIPGPARDFGVTLRADRVQRRPGRQIGAAHPQLLSG